MMRAEEKMDINMSVVPPDVYRAEDIDIEITGIALSSWVLISNLLGNVYDHFKMRLLPYFLATLWVGSSQHGLVDAVSDYSSVSGGRFKLVNSHIRDYLSIDIIHVTNISTSRLDDCERESRCIPSSAKPNRKGGNSDRRIFHGWRRGLYWKYCTHHAP
jgi:hypothetical protein